MPSACSTLCALGGFSTKCRHCPCWAFIAHPALKCSLGRPRPASPLPTCLPGPSYLPPLQVAHISPLTPSLFFPLPLPLPPPPLLRVSGPPTFSPPWPPAPPPLSRQPFFPRTPAGLTSHPPPLSSSSETPGRQAQQVVLASPLPAGDASQFSGDKSNSPTCWKSQLSNGQFKGRRRGQQWTCGESTPGNPLSPPGQGAGVSVWRPEDEG